MRKWEMVELHRLWSLGGTSFWQQLSGKATHLRQQSPFTWTSRAVVRIFFNQHPPLRWWYQVVRRRVCHSGVFQPAHAPKYYGPYICGCSRSSIMIIGKHSSSRSSREGEMRSYSRRANTVTMHSDLIQVIVIIWAILMCWLHTISGQQIKALGRRLLTGRFMMSSKQLLENTLLYGDV